MGASIHVWTIGLDETTETVGALLGLLTGAERARAARFRTTELRVRFVVAHGALRTILSAYIGVAPAAVRLDTTQGGRPFVPGAPFDFNLSHSDGLAVVAVTASGHVGVDVERLRRIDDEDAVVRRFFAAGEIRQYEALRTTERTSAFYSTWTRKEAFVKALGSGLQRDLKSFEVEVSPQAVCPRINLAEEDGRSTWSLRSFSPHAHYVAAVALDREIEALEFFDWSADALAAARASPFASR